MNPTVIECPEFRCRIIEVPPEPEANAAIPQSFEPEYLIQVTRPLRMQRKRKLVGGFKSAEELALIMGRECARRAADTTQHPEIEQLSFA